MVCKLVVVVLSAVVIAVKCDWGQICRDHPYLHTPGTGQVMDFDSKNLTKRVGCSLTFDFDYGEQYAAKFCQALFHDFHITGEHVYDTDKKTITCEYERFHYCAHKNEIMINGKCWLLSETAENFADADEKCRAKGSELPKGDDLLTVEWLVKIYGPNSEKTMPDIWIDAHPDTVGHYRPAKVKPDAKSVLKFLYDFDGLYTIGDIKPADVDEKHYFYCGTLANRYPTAFLNFCDTVRDVFKLSAAYFKSTCFIMSSSVYRPSLNSDGTLNTDGYHENCKFTYNMDAYAVAPTSYTRYEGIKRAVLSRNPGLDIKKWGPTLLPGHSVNSAEMNKPCGTDKLLYKSANSFVYNRGGGNFTPVHTSGWDESALKKSCADLSMDAIGMKEFKENGKFAEPTAEDKLFRVYEMPRLFRGRIVCGAGYKHEDIHEKSCETGWEPYTREDGTVICHKAIVQRTTYANLDRKCKNDLGGVSLSAVESGKEQKIIHGCLVPRGVEAMFIGMTTTNGFDFTSDYDGTPVYYSNWGGNEPNNYYEKCGTMYFQHGGRWNDLDCEGKNSPVLGAVCSKHAH